MPEIFIHPDRPASRRQPLRAIRHMRALIADKEDTSHVFHIIESLNGNSQVKTLKRFLGSADGRARYSERRYLPPLLDDHETLRKLPEGSVGRAYVDFMEREGLSAQGLVDEFEKYRGGKADFDDDLSWFGNRLRDTHDLFHVLTGYGRDALGEDALLAFSHSQHGGFGIMFIAIIGAWEVYKVAPKEAKIFSVFLEGRRSGRLAQKIAEQDIPALLAENLDSVRTRLGIRPPVAYEHAHQIFQRAGQDPYLVNGTAGA